MSKKDQVIGKIFSYHSNVSSNDEFDKFRKFWQKSYNHFNIIMLLGSAPAENPGFSYEEICEKYPHKLASRTTILSILNEGVKNNFFDKNKDTQDLRKHNYKLYSEQKKKVIAWVDNHPINNFRK